MTGKLFILAAPSGAGKTSLVREAISRLHHRYPIKLIVSYTSRPPRKNEIEGIDYHFVSEESFQEKIAQKGFLEFSFGYGHYYGSPLGVLEQLRKGESCIVVMGIQGIERALSCVPNAITIWITTNTVEDLEARLRKRGCDDMVIAERIKVARREFEWIRTTQLFKYRIVNDSFESASSRLCEIIVNVLNQR